jgi:hypothetical protein
MTEGGQHLNTAEFIRPIGVVGNAVLYTCAAAMLLLAGIGVVVAHSSEAFALIWNYLPLLLPFLFLGTLLRVGAWVAAGLLERQQ